MMPQSRYFTIPNLGVVRRLKVAGHDILVAFILRVEQLRSTYITGQLEYDTATLANEYIRDKDRDSNTKKPQNYFYQGKPTNTWLNIAEVFYANWGKLLVQNTVLSTEKVELIEKLNQERKSLA